jgi:outer membrane PBP1 activator LpoA protein
MFYDEQMPDAAAAYRAALADGAHMVIGPLLKESVAQVAAAAGTINTLALNYLDSTVLPPAGFYQFALWPEDEARDTAARAVADGNLRALVLAPDNEWGRRMLTAFEPALLERGGQVLDYSLYSPGETDFTADIQRLLQLDRSRARHRQLSANLGVELEFEPRRRSDADFIFLVANVASGRLIRPQLRFLYAGDLPTYATSAIYQAGSAGDADLDGVMFSDAPAVLGTDERATGLRAGLSAHWPAGSLARMRFYAMGYDAYALGGTLAAGGISTLPGLSGVLSMDSQRRIHRQMPWAEFRDGRIAVLPEPLPDVPSTPAGPL